MKTTFEFEIRNLLEMTGDKVSDPKSPMHFAEQIAKQTKKKFNWLARVSFPDERIHQDEDDSFTGNDTLIIGL